MYEKEKKEQLIKQGYRHLCDYKYLHMVVKRSKSRPSCTATLTNTIEVATWQAENMEDLVQFMPSLLKKKKKLGAEK